MTKIKPLALMLGALLATSALAQSQSGAPADVPRDHWAFSAVDNLFKVGLLKGYPDGLFRGSRPASRFEMAAALGALYGQQQVKLSDLQAQVDTLKAKPAQTPEVTKAETTEFAKQIETLRLSVAAMRSQREDIDGLNVTFKNLFNQLHRLRSDLKQMHEDLGKVKAGK